MSNIAVIIPTYNRPSELFEAVKSVLHQSMLPDEILIINDGELHSVFDKLSDIDIVKIFHNKTPRGANYSRNKGAELANGNILMFLDDDDAWEKDKIKNQLQVFQKSDTIGLVYSNRNIFDQNGKYIRRITSHYKGNLYPEILISNLIGTTSSVALRKDIFINAGGFDENLNALQDFDLWIRVCRITHIGLDENHCVNYTIHNSSNRQVSASGKKKLEAIKYLLRKYLPEIKNLPFKNRMKLKSSYYFYVAKSFRKSSISKSLTYAIRSFLYYPNIKVMGLYVPNLFLRYISK